MKYMEYIAAFILYGLFVYVFVKFSNKKSQAIIKKNVFEDYYQVFFLVGVILFIIGYLITDKTTFAHIMKISMFVLVGIDFLIYIFSKLKDYPSISWVLWSVLLDILVFPIVIAVVLAIWGMIMALLNRDCNNSCYCD